MNLKNILKVVFVIIGTTIGAGFASGKEIYLFFNSYGPKGILGILLSCILTGLIVYKLFAIIQDRNVKTYDDFLNLISKKQKVNHFVNCIINIFLLVSFFIMVAGFSAYLTQEFGIHNFFGSIIICVLCYIIFMNNMNGIVKANAILIPVLICGILMIGVKNIDIFQQINEKMVCYNHTNWIVSSVLYSSYNSILLIPMLITLNKYVKNKKQAAMIALVTALLLILLALIISGLLLMVDLDINTLEIPMLYVASLLGNFFRYFYGFIILFSIFTTAISAGYSFLENTTKNRRIYRAMAILICICGIPISSLGFSNLVNLLYPIFGYLGIVQLFMIFTQKA